MPNMDIVLLGGVAGLVLLGVVMVIAKKDGKFIGPVIGAILSLLSRRAGNPKKKNTPEP